MQVLIMLRRGDLAGAQVLAAAQGMAGCRALVHLAQGEHAAALAVVVPLREAAEVRGWVDEQLHLLVIEALARWGCGEEEQALVALDAALALAEPPGIVRVFVDNHAAMAPLLRAAETCGVRPQFVRALLEALDKEEAGIEGDGGAQGEGMGTGGQGRMRAAAPLPEPLSARELEILGLIAAGRSNQEIGAQLYLALDTVKGHNRRIFDKLGVQRRTEAVAMARALGLL
jgi:LuxR family maltose regulon positive regulatory protein